MIPIPTPPTFPPIQQPLEAVLHRQPPRRLRAGQRLSARRAGVALAPAGRAHLLRVRRRVPLRPDRARHQVPLPRSRIHLQGKELLLCFSNVVQAKPNLYSKGACMYHVPTEGGVTVS